MRLGVLNPSRGIRSLLGSIRRQQRTAATAVPIVAPSITSSEVTLVSTNASVSTKVSHTRHLKVRDSIEGFQAADIVKDSQFYFHIEGEPEGFLTLRVEHTLFRVSHLILSSHGLR